MKKIIGKALIVAVAMGALLIASGCSTCSTGTCTTAAPTCYTGTCR